MAEDWRVKLVLPEEHHGSRFTGWLHEHRLEQELADRLRGRVVVSQDENTFFLYAESREQAEAAIDVVGKFLTERQESAKGGMDQWEVQVTLPDHASTRELADKLEGEGLHVSRRWRYLVISVPSEEDGQELAERIRSEAPPEAEIAVAGSYGEVVANKPYSGFSLFGGLGN